MTHKELSEKYAWLFAQSFAYEPIFPIEIGHGLDVGLGWLPLLDETLAQIGDEVSRLSKSKAGKFSIVEIAEQNRTLLIGTRGANDRIREIIDDAMDSASQTCGDCGKPGEPHLINVHDVWILCTACAQEHPKSRYETVRIATRGKQASS